ncbi:MAG: hypothetical protein ACPIOQ_54015 [Promethearchaeia archaeon]
MGTVTCCRCKACPSRRLEADKLLHIDGPTWQVRLEGGAHEAIMGVCDSTYMQQLSAATRARAAGIFKWFGAEMVARHLQLFTSW